MAASATECSEIGHTWPLKGCKKAGGSKNELYLASMFTIGPKTARNLK